MRARGHLGYPGIDGRIILRWIFRKWDVGAGLDRSGSGQLQVADCCECGNEPATEYVYKGKIISK
jgi:hypothetical protein